MRGCIRTTVHHGPIASATRSITRATPRPSPRCAARSEVDGRVRVHAQGAPDLARGHALSDGRAARQHRRDRSRARSATPTCSPGASSAASWCACAVACGASASELQIEPRRDRPRRGAPRPTRRRFLPTAYRDLDELEGFLEHLAREVYDPGLKALLEALLGDERAARGDPASRRARSRLRPPARRAPARPAGRAPPGHHAYLGGLLEHTVAVATWRSSCARCTRAWIATCC